MPTVSTSVIGRACIFCSIKVSLKATTVTGQGHIVAGQGQATTVTGQGQAIAPTMLRLRSAFVVEAQHSLKATTVPGQGQAIAPTMLRLRSAFVVEAQHSLKATTVG